MSKTRRASRRRWATDRGSAAAELVLVVPIFLAFTGVLVIGSQLVLDRQQVDDAARTAVEAAVSQPTGADAASAAAASVSEATLGEGLDCGRVSVAVDSSALRPGGSVAVTVSCSVKVPAVGILGFPTSIALTATDNAPLEPYRTIGT